MKNAKSKSIKEIQEEREEKEVAIHGKNQGNITIELADDLFDYVAPSCEKNESKAVTDKNLFSAQDILFEHDAQCDKHEKSICIIQNGVFEVRDSK